MPKPTVTPVPINIDFNEEPLTPAEVLARFKIPFNAKDPKGPAKKVYELTRRRGNRPPMPSHRVGKELRFYWSRRFAAGNTKCRTCRVRDDAASVTQRPPDGSQGKLL